MITLKETQPTTNASRYLIITSLIKCKNIVLYYLSTYKTGFITMLGKKRREFCLKSTAQIVCDQIFQNKYHEEKTRETKRISLYLGACAVYSKAKIWFISGTP